MNYWYAYRHTNGRIIPKRWFDDRDIIEAKESDFVQDITAKFLAEDRRRAMMMAVKLLGDE
jgi:hypothetical protein